MKKPGFDGVLETALLGALDEAFERPSIGFGLASQGESGMTRPTAAELLANPEALLNRGHLRELGLDPRRRRFRACPVIALPGYSRPLIRVADYLELVARST